LIWETTKLGEVNSKLEDNAGIEIFKKRDPFTTYGWSVLPLREQTVKDNSNKITNLNAVINSADFLLPKVLM